MLNLLCDHSKTKGLDLNVGIASMVSVTIYLHLNKTQIFHIATG